VGSDPCSEYVLVQPNNVQVNAQGALIMTLTNVLQSLAADDTVRWVSCELKRMVIICIGLSGSSFIRSHVS